MVIAALIVFVALLVAWILAPEDGRASSRPSVERPAVAEPELMPRAA